LKLCVYTTFLYEIGGFPFGIVEENHPSIRFRNRGLLSEGPHGRRDVIPIGLNFIHPICDNDLDCCERFAPHPLPGLLAPTYCIWIRDWSFDIQGTSLHNDTNALRFDQVLKLIAQVFLKALE
jgi:hypothetical protein